MKRVRGDRRTCAMLGAVVACALLLPGCAGWTRWPWGTTQRWPGPMEQTVTPLPPGQSQYLEEGPEEVLVVRHADPVRVRPAGLAGAYPLRFYDKSLRVHAGSGVGSDPGGRIEIVWPNGNALVLSDETNGVVGSPSKGQASFLFLSLERARIDFKVADQVRLPTGIRLSAATGPVVVSRASEDVLRVANQSKGPIEVGIRDAVITLDSGQVVDLPELQAGGTPLREDPLIKTTRVPGHTLSWSGEVEMQREADGAVRLRALGEHEIHANGVSVRLERDQSVTLMGLGGGR